MSDEDIKARPLIIPISAELGDHANAAMWIGMLRKTASQFVRSALKQRADQRKKDDKPKFNEEDDILQYVP